MEQLKELDKQLEDLITQLRDDQFFINKAVKFHKRRREHDIYAYFLGRRIQIEQYIGKMEMIYFQLGDLIKKTDPKETDNRVRKRLLKKRLDDFYKFLIDKKYFTDLSDKTSERIKQLVSQRIDEYFKLRQLK